jgi:hypothetical protein
MSLFLTRPYDGTILPGSACIDSPVVGKYVVDIVSALTADVLGFVISASRIRSQPGACIQEV